MSFNAISSADSAIPAMPLVAEDHNSFDRNSDLEFLVHRKHGFFESGFVFDSGKICYCGSPKGGQPTEVVLVFGTNSAKSGNDECLVILQVCLIHKFSMNRLVKKLNELWLSWVLQGLPDSMEGHVATSGPEASVKLDIIVLEGDFNTEDDEGWSQVEFESHIVKEREGKRPLLTGELQVTLKEGVGTLGYLVDVTGYLVDITCYLVDVTGDLVDITGYLVDVTGYLVDITDYLVVYDDVTGYLVDITGYLPEDAFDPNRVKCVVDNHGYAIYFSRGLILFNKSGKVNPQFPYLLHLGIQVV
ncbi:hypothetical protein ACS0TY_008411 [Phlomoides rotata]